MKWLWYYSAIISYVELLCTNVTCVEYINWIRLLSTHLLQKKCFLKGNVYPWQYKFLFLNKKKIVSKNKNKKRDSKSHSDGWMNEWIVGWVLECIKLYPAVMMGGRWHISTSRYIYMGHINRELYLPRYASADLSCSPFGITLSSSIGGWCLLHLLCYIMARIIIIIIPYLVFVPTLHNWLHIHIFCAAQVDDNCWENCPTYIFRLNGVDSGWGDGWEEEEEEDGWLAGWFSSG